MHFDLPHRSRNTALNKALGQSLPVPRMVNTHPHLHPHPRHLHHDDFSLLSDAGIGKAFATKLAQSGFNVALVSRSKDKLTKVADEISKTSPSSQTLVIPCDAAIPKSPDVVVKALGDRDIRVLINNVGVSNAIPTELADMEEAEIARIIAVNATFNAQLSRLLIPTLKQEKASRHSAIVNVSSVAGIVSVPLQV